MSEPIYDRLPTEADGEWVLRWENGTWWATESEMLCHGDIWMRQPPPPKPPIDTSLAASIERFRFVPTWMHSKEYCEDEGLIFDDRDRVIEAARKWDELEHSGVGAVPMYSRELSPEMQELVDNDPDGVGEWWRLLGRHESICCGDECKSRYDDDGKWGPTQLPETSRQNNDFIYRRRIEAEQ